MDYDVIVIGAGVGGLSAGATLAARGFDTLLVEQNDFVGGCASSFESGGYQFDVGACIIEVSRAHDCFYEGLGLKREDYVTFLKNDPLYEILDMATGERFLLPSSTEGVTELIARHSPRDAEAFVQFINGLGATFDEFVTVIMTTPQGRLRDLFRVFLKYPAIIPRMKYLFTPYGKLLDDMFEDPFTRRLFANYSVFGGLPPSVQSGLMLWLCYSEREDTYYPRGGMGAVPAGMARALRDVGGELVLGTPVRKIIVERGRAKGVTLADGTDVTSRAVVSNANALSLYMDMIGPDSLPRSVVKGIQSYELAPAVTVGYLGLDYRPPMQAQHIMSMAGPELIDNFWFDVYKNGIAIPQAVGLVSSPSYMDPSLAPEGHHSLSFITMAPPVLNNGKRWNDIKLDYLDRGIDMLDALFLPGVKEHVVHKTIATPEDFEKRLSMPGGGIYVFSMSMLSQMAFRPGNRSRCVKYLYLCGASSNACSVPGAIHSGMLAADLAAEDLERSRAR